MLPVVLLAILALTTLAQDLVLVGGRVIDPETGLDACPHNGWSPSLRR